MKTRLLFLFILAAGVFSCNTSNKKQVEKDSIVTPTQVEMPNKTDTVRDTVYLEKPAEDLASLRVGRHKITLQWISWDEPGFADISKAEDGWYIIKGEQIGKPEEEYLRIDGKIKPVSKTELLFNGTIEMKVLEGNNAEPCLRTGSKVFLTKGNRKYWRLQDMLNCDKVVTDYVDIYF